MVFIQYIFPSGKMKPIKHLASLWVQKGEKRIKDEDTFGRDSTTPASLIFILFFSYFLKKNLSFSLKELINEAIFTSTGRAQIHNLLRERIYEV